MDENQRMFDVKELEKRHAKAIIAVLMICFFLAYGIYHMDSIAKVYTHLFYLPIIMAGAWFHKKAYILTGVLACLHIALEYIQDNSFTYAPFLRVSVFFLVTAVVVTISENKEQLQKKLEEQFIYIEQIIIRSVILWVVAIRRESSAILHHRSKKY